MIVTSLPKRLEDRRELAADDAAAEHDEPLRDFRLREQSRRSRRSASESRPSIGGRSGNEPVAMIACLKVTSSPPSTAIVCRVLERAGALDPLDAVRLEEQRDARGHLLDDAVLPLVRRAEFELEAAELHAELVEGVLGLLQRERGLHPRLRRDAADAQAGAAELGLAIDARDLRAELRSADRGRVTTRPSSENGDVDFHRARWYRATRGQPSW